MCSDCRFIVFRRVFLILSLLYLMRAITMYITVLPVASKTYYCSPKANQTSAYLVTTRVLQLISGFGLSVNGKHTYCGDYIYSGHTVVLVLSYLLISECKLTVNINNILTISIGFMVEYVKMSLSFFQIRQKDFFHFTGYRG